MSLAVLGVNHRSCPVEVRERLRFAEDELPEALAALRQRLGDAGTVILSTCNRVELYAHCDVPAQELLREMGAFLAEFRSIPDGDFLPLSYSHAEREAVGHLFRVTASLDSMVVGEAQILGQVREAYLLARRAQATDKTINALFEKAFSVAKDVRTETTINEGKVSIGSVAVDLAVSIFMDLAGKTVMVVGSGKMGELALKNLIARGASQVLLVNRTIEKAQTLAAQFNGEPLPFEALHAELHRADIVITSTGAQEPILGPEAFHAALKRRGQAPMFVIDIAVPRNVEPAVNELDNVYLYDVDDLRHVAEENLAERQGAIANALEFVERGVEHFCAWRGGLVAAPTIASMAEELHAIRERELAKTLAALPGLTEPQRAEIEYLSRRLVNAILHQPVTQLKHEVARQHDPHTVLHLVKRLFGLKESS